MRKKMKLTKFNHSIPTAKKAQIAKKPRSVIPRYISFLERVFAFCHTKSPINPKAKSKRPIAKKSKAVQLKSFETFDVIAGIMRRMSG